MPGADAEGMGGLLLECCITLLRMYVLQRLLGEVRDVDADAGLGGGSYESDRIWGERLNGKRLSG